MSLSWQAITINYSHAGYKIFMKHIKLTVLMDSVSVTWEYIPEIGSALKKTRDSDDRC